MVDIIQDLTQVRSRSAPDQAPDPSRAHPSLERANLIIGQGISFCDDWNQVDLGVQSSHELDVEGFQPEPLSMTNISPYSPIMSGLRITNLRVSGRLNEVDASVNPVVDQFRSVDSVLLLEISVESSFNIVNNGFPSDKQEPSVNILLQKRLIWGKDDTLTNRHC
jgi:hypothetical protein